MNRKTRNTIKSLFTIAAITAFFMSLPYIFAKENYVDYDNRDAFFFREENFESLEGTMIYRYEDDEYTSMFGIDISEHQKSINWNSVKDEGVEFVYIRVGFRGYTEGIIHLDSRFEEYYREAKAHDIPVGFYFFSQATTRKEAIEEAKFVLKHIKNKDYDLPIVYDYEDPSDESRMHLTTKEERTANAVAFLDYIKENHHEAMVYTNLDWMKNWYDMDVIGSYNIWFAQYNYVPQSSYPFFIWQYSDRGIIDGIDVPVDLDLMFIRKNAQPQ